MSSTELRSAKDQLKNALNHGLAMQEPAEVIVSAMSRRKDRICDTCVIECCGNCYCDTHKCGVEVALENYSSVAREKGLTKAKV